VSKGIREFVSAFDAYIAPYTQMYLHIQGFVIASSLTPLIASVAPCIHAYVYTGVREHEFVCACDCPVAPCSTQTAQA